jgi:hypothetical protein
VGTATFDANDHGALAEFFKHLPGPVDHVVVTAGRPYYAHVTDMDFEQARNALEASAMQMLGVVRYASGSVRPGGENFAVQERDRRLPSTAASNSSEDTDAQIHCTGR